MHISRLPLLMVTVLLAAVFFLGNTPCKAESGSTTKSPAQTGYFRSTDNVMQMQRIKNADRQAAAKKIAAYRKELSDKAAATDKATATKPSLSKKKGETK